MDRTTVIPTERGNLIIESAEDVGTAGTSAIQMDGLGHVLDLSKLKEFSEWNRNCTSATCPTT